MDRNKSISKRKKVIIFLVMLFIAILLINHRIMVNIGLHSATQVSRQTMEYIKEKLKVYDKYQENERMQLSTELSDKEVGISGDTEKNKIENEEYDITLDNIFSGITIENNGFLLVSRSDKVLATNKTLSNKDKKTAVSECKNLWKNGKAVNETLKKVKYQGKRWYIQKEEYKDYKTYVFLSVDKVYRQYYMVTLAIMVIYFLICGGIGGIASYFERKNYSRLEKYYQIIEAVNSVFTGDLLVDIHSGKAEWIKNPENIKKSLTEYMQADKILEEIANIYVQDSDREEYLRFVDIKTVGDRLSSEKVISFIYQDIYREWIKILIIPQHTNAEGSVDAVLYLIRNVTEEVKKEKEYQKQLKVAGDAKTNFLRRMSHDIRTPINGIRGIIEIAEHNPDDMNIQREYRAKIKTATGYLLDLVNNILDMSKLESGEIKLEHKPFNLTELLRRANEITMMQCKDCGITYHIKEYDVSHTDLIGSPVHLQQILMNLSSNAVKYNKPNGDIFVSTREVSDTDSIARFEFICQDTGIGMSEEFQKRIFEPFTQEYADARTKYAGTGLGMAITKELVNLQEGTITVESEEGEGSKFTVCLSFEIDPSPKEKLAAGEKKDYSIEGFHILLVEDNDLNMEVAEYLLKEKGAIIMKAWNGKEAVEMFSESEEGEYDVILMDIMMPVMGGWEATRRIRSMNRADAASVPIIAMTANAFQDDIEHSKKAGMSEHVIKPLNMDALIQKISEVVKSNQKC